jgi:hypothetical protein
LAGLCWHAFDAHVRYCGALGRLATRLVRSVTAEAVQVSLATPRAAPDPPAAMMLESEVGACAVGMFLVENRLGQAVSAPVAPSTFVDAEGREVRPRLTFAPRVVSLQPGEQAVVRVAAAFDDTLLPEVWYRGTISVPGVSSASVAVVLRRRVAAPDLAAGRGQ